MSILTIPPTRAEDKEAAKEWLFRVFGERPWTVEEYLAIANSETGYVEFSEGKVVTWPMPTSGHQRIASWFYRLLFAWALKHGGEAFYAPYPVRLWAQKLREPDVLLYTAAHVDRIQTQFGGPPDLVVEVLSPSTAYADLNDKVIEYAQAGIPEYWVADVETPRLQQFVLVGAAYELRVVLEGSGRLQAATLEDLAIDLADVYRH